MINTTRTLFVTGDTAPTLSGVVTSGTTPASLVGAAVVLQFRKPDRAGQVSFATVTDAAAGAWSYTWATGELIAGTWEVEVQVTYAGGAVQTFPTEAPARFVVRSEIG